jgi:putative flippase GtrA
MATLNERLRSITFHPTEWIEQGVKFLLVGVMNTGIDVGLYFALTRYVAAFAEANVAAKVVSYTAGVVNSYLWNRSWTFKSRDQSRKTFVPFVLTNLIGLSINAAVLWLGLLLSLPEIMALLLATSVVLLWNFIISKVVVFNR